MEKFVIEDALYLFESIKENKMISYDDNLINSSNNKINNDKLAYNPSILIDFENRVFISYYAEPESFEAFVPDGWIGKYQDFTEEIPEKQRYWMDENGKNLIGE